MTWEVSGNIKHIFVDYCRYIYTSSVTPANLMTASVVMLPLLCRNVVWLLFWEIILWFLGCILGMLMCKSQRHAFLHMFGGSHQSQFINLFACATAFEGTVSGIATVGQFPKIEAMVKSAVGAQVVCQRLWTRNDCRGLGVTIQHSFCWEYDSFVSATVLLGNCNRPPPPPPPPGQRE